MYDDDYGPAPIDSYDLYAMGLRSARCNGCEFARWKHELGDRCLVLNISGWPTVYELDAAPRQGQSEPHEHDGRPIRFHASFMSVEHSDECYHWKPKGKPSEIYTVGKALVRIHEAKGHLEFRIESASSDAFHDALDAFKEAVPHDSRQYNKHTQTWTVDPAYQDTLEALVEPAPYEVRRPGWIKRFKAFVNRMRGD